MEERNLKTTTTGRKSVWNHPNKGIFWVFNKREYLATVRNKKVIDSERVQGHYLPVISMVLGKGGRDYLGARMF